MKKIFTLFLISVSFLAQAQISSPKYSNEFLSIGIGARALAMSGTQTALTDDATAIYWNPAGLLNIKTKYQASLMHAEYFAGSAKFDFVGFSVDIDSASRLGVAVVRFGV
ncbi:MAG: hypothetical protein H7Y04_12295, partial [Verrucomicrobia bacterium]|nr:hypothetical protein [Cytophagales bacterium]